MIEKSSHDKIVQILDLEKVCNPRNLSYSEIAKMTGMDSSYVEKIIKKYKTLEDYLQKVYDGYFSEYSREFGRLLEKRAPDCAYLKYLRGEGLQWSGGNFTLTERWKERRKLVSERLKGIEEFHWDYEGKHPVNYRWRKAITLNYSKKEEEYIVKNIIPRIEELAVKTAEAFDIDCLKDEVEGLADGYWSNFTELEWKLMHNEPKIPREAIIKLMKKEEQEKLEKELASVLPDINIWKSIKKRTYRTASNWHNFFEVQDVVLFPEEFDKSVVNEAKNITDQ